MTSVEYAVYLSVFIATFRDWGSRTDDLVEVRFASLDDPNMVISTKMPRSVADDFILKACYTIGGTALRERDAFIRRDWMPAIWCGNYAISMNAI